MDMMHETKNSVERVYKTTVTECMILYVLERCKSNMKLI